MSLKMLKVFCLFSLCCIALSLAKTYVRSYEAVNFYQAFINCKQAGMELATVTSPDEEAQIYELLSEDTGIGPLNGSWLGAFNLPNPTSSVYYWLATGAPVVYSNWLPGQPDHSSGIENCLQWYNLGEEAGGMGWNDIECQYEMKYVCEIRD